MGWNACTPYSERRCQPTATGQYCWGDEACDDGMVCHMTFSICASEMDEGEPCCSYTAPGTPDSKGKAGDPVTQDIIQIKVNNESFSATTDSEIQGS